MFQPPPPAPSSFFYYSYYCYYDDADNDGEDDDDDDDDDDDEKRLEGKGTVLYYRPCTNKEKIPPSCRVAHGMIFAWGNNPPTKTSTANNTWK